MIASISSAARPAANAATAIRPIGAPEATAAPAIDATAPAHAPASARDDVYVAHFRYGRRKSPSIANPPTAKAASGPNATAANSTGTNAIDASKRSLNRTLPRSAAIPINANSTSAHAGGSLDPPTASSTPTTAATAAKPAT